MSVCAETAQKIVDHFTLESLHKFAIVPPQRNHSSSNLPIYYLTWIPRSEGAITETLPYSIMYDHAESRLHAARVIVTLFAGKTRESRSGTRPVRTPVVFSTRLTVTALQRVVVCPGLLVATVTILLSSES